MGGENNGTDTLRSSGISRRVFLKIAGAGLLTGCKPTRRPIAAPVLGEAEEPSGVPTATPVPTDTPVPTFTPMPIVEVRRPDAIKMYPDAPSKVVHAHHAGVWDGEELVPNALRQMLDASITELTGLNDATEAWAALFAPNEWIAIKVNTFGPSDLYTHAPLVLAVAESLQDADVPAEQIVIFDRRTDELVEAGYTIVKDGPGVRCYGTDSQYTAGWELVDSRIQLSDILLQCHALINIPVLKAHNIAGVTFGMKNHYGTFDKPQGYHGSVARGIAELNVLPPIRDRTRLVIGDVLAACIVPRNSYPYWTVDVVGDSILMSFDTLAHDTLGLQMLTEMLEAAGRGSTAVAFKSGFWLEHGAKVGLGTNDPDNIEVIEVTTG